MKILVLDKNNSTVVLLPRCSHIPAIGTSYGRAGYIPCPKVIDSISFPDRETLAILGIADRETLAILGTTAEDVDAIITVQ